MQLKLRQNSYHLIKKSSIHLIKKNSVSFEEKISFLSISLLGEDSVNIFSFISKEELHLLLNHILLKTNRRQIDIMILNKYLRTLTQFMSLLTKNERRRSDIQPLLNKIGEHLKWKYVGKNTILFRAGDIGAMFYLILRGSVSVLIPNSIKVQLSLDDYLRYLNVLLCLKESELFNLSLESNKEVYNIIVDKSNKEPQHNANPIYFSDYQVSNLQTNYNSCEEYLKVITPQANSTESYHPTVVIWLYHKVIELKEGDTFGETALLSRNLIRTATIYTNEETFCGTLNQNEFNSCIKKIQVQIKRERTLFILSYNLFNDVNYDVFVKRYWNYFTFNQMKQGEILFNQYEQREMIYFLKEGSIELISKMSINDLNSIIYLLNEDNSSSSSTTSLAKCAQPVMSKEQYFNVNRQYRVGITKNKDVIGLDDIVNNDNRLFCTAICASKQLSYFAIHIKLFYSLLDIFKCRSMEYASLTKKKKDIMLNRLRTIRFAELNSIISCNKPNKAIQSLIEEFNPLKRKQDLQLALAESKIKNKKTPFPPVLSITKEHCNMTMPLKIKKPLMISSYEASKTRINAKLILKKRDETKRLVHYDCDSLQTINKGGQNTLLLKYILKANKRKYVNRMKNEIFLHTFSSVFPDNSQSNTVYHNNNTRSISTSMNNSTSNRIGMIDLLINDTSDNASVMTNESRAKSNKNKMDISHKGIIYDKLPLHYMLKAKPMTIRLRKA